MELLKQTKDCVVTIRVTSEIKDRIDHESEQQNVSLNTLISRIISKYLEWDKYAKETRFLPIPKQFLIAILQQVDNEKIKSIASTTCKNSLKDSIQFMHDSVNIETLTQTLKQWLDASSFPVRHIEKDGLNRYIIKHEMGKKWAFYFTSLVSTLLNSVGYFTENLVTDDELVSFDIKKL